MPKLPSYQDAGVVSPAITRDPGVSAPVEAFQSTSGIVAKELAPGLKLVADVVKQEEIRKDQAAVNERRRELLDIETEQTEWLAQQKGANAFEAKAKLDKAVDARLEKIRGDLKNDRQRAAFAEVERDWRVGLNRTSSRTIAAEMDRHYDSVDEKLLETSSRAAQKSASLGDFDRTQKEWLDQEKVIAGYAERKGLDDVQRKALLDSRKSNFHSGIALQLIADGNDKSAQAYLDANKKEFDADDSLKIQHQLTSRQSEKAAEHRVAVADKMQDIEAMGARGVIPPKNFISDQEIDGAYPKNPERAQQLKRRRDEGLRFAVSAANLHQQGNDVLISAIRAPQPSPKTENFAEQARHNDMVRQMAATILKQRVENPIEYAAQQNIGAVNDIDFANPESVTAEIANRQKTAKIMKDRFGSAVKLLTDTEASSLTRGLKTSTAAQKRQMFSTFSSALGNDLSSYSAIMRQIAPDDPVTAIAGVYAGRGRSQAADLMLKGQDILRPAAKEDGRPDKGKLWPMPPESDLRKRFESKTRDAFAGHPQAQSDLYQAAISIYAATSAQEGDASGMINTERMDQSIKLATGGVEKWNGKSTVMPYGMERSQFKDGLYSRIDAVLASGGISDKVSRSTLRGLPLEAIGEGRYVFRSGDGILINKNNKPVVIDFNLQNTSVIGGP